MTGAVSVRVPRALASIVGGERTVDVALDSVATVAAVLDVLAERYPVLGRRIRDETGALRRYVNVYVDGEDVRLLGGVSTEVAPGQEIQILQSVAGG
ncbi:MULTISPECIES: ubiquitin-like small modifier protein 1 [Rhodococcus]|uniref:Ubiquitin-like small modifier protein 1 n=1 Tax=Rhodococcus oxybenzonivorans TaxID=1990687 RepID=A0AAE4V5H6_9NOCA|nr:MULTISPECIES: ubiquitin-like small modifier protein 1 [Rhodococcus]MDV7241383.1 ubiquitin-like small modifier protein 1 [Rhodococcus oxybenzonivorans]MDV7268519.1 ubiquitin-like small modifier protein 1 [Rhodococcus oxybenzonivorans]MDV7274084.1 ubiquitin-like small modifier protein 1 [Rhodococcus oxybenzonivorans]MDV7333664.1 ubiquitin-like small modifier protein 1 [Rhodococcus oxybenzonivorans]MDV7343083.1 ubiquitin-like small modifier protein 1 [Rhodococcus oxybenzonivorans]